MKMENIGQPKDKNETTIMEITEEIKWTENEKRKLNLIRLQLKIIWIEDIFEEDEIQYAPYNKKTDINFPKTLVPKTWYKYWNEKINEIRNILYIHREKIIIMEEIKQNNTEIIQVKKYGRIEKKKISKLQKRLIGNINIKEEMKEKMEKTKNRILYSKLWIGKT